MGYINFKRLLKSHSFTISWISGDFLEQILGAKSHPFADLTRLSDFLELILPKKVTHSPIFKDPVTFQS